MKIDNSYSCSYFTIQADRPMHPQQTKIYVAVGNELQDGFQTLEWAIKKWKSHPISIVLLHISSNFIEEFVYTPFGRLPASSVSEEKLELIRKEENEKTDKFLNKYKAFCGKVKTEILKVEKNDKTLHGFIIDLISEHYITNLVMGLTFMNSSSWRSRSAISGSVFIHRNKPSFCEFFIIFGGKQVFLRLENDERIMEDDQGVTITKMKDRVNYKSWLERMFSEKIIDLDQLTSTSTDASNSKNQWEINAQKIEDYFLYLFRLNLDEVEEFHHDNDTSQASPLDSEMQELAKSNMSVAEKREYLRRKINEARDKIQCYKKEAKINSERHAKADWAICLCNRRAEELEALSKEEGMIRNELKKELDTTKELLHKVITEVEESKNKLITISELQSDISNKMGISILAKSEAELQLEKAIATREDLVKDIEELRQQRDVIRRRIEFCKEKEAIELVKEMNEMSLSCSFREYTAEEIRLATDNFSERLRLKSGGDWTSFYKGRLNHGSVAIKIFNSIHKLSWEDFQVKVNFLGNIRHPNLIAMMGFCCEPRCLVFEYMQNGSISDILFSPKRNQTLKWYDRIRIAAQVFSSLTYLYQAQPKPIVHGHLTPSNILLDRNLNAKVSGFGQIRYFDENCVGSDIHAFGILLLHLLTGGLVNEEMLTDKEALVHVLDDTAGPWPLDFAVALAGLAFRCLSINQRPKTDLGMLNLMEELHELKKKTDELVARGEFESQNCGGEQKQDSDDAPSVFLCPIFKEVMKNPYIAADGFSYEKEAIEEWLRMGRDTSPMTNLRLNHKFLTSNHTLRSFIEEWKNKV